MDIVHVVETLDVGGLERMVIDLASRQKACGHRVRIACLFSEGSLATVARSAGVEVEAIAKRTGADAGALRRLRRNLVTRQTQVLHTHNASAHYHGVLASLGAGPLARINTRHGMGSSGAVSRGDRLYRLAVAFSDRVVAVCEAARSRFVERRLVPAAKIVVVPNGIDPARFAPRSDEARDALLREIGAEDGGFVVGTVGRLEPAKDQATLLDAFAILLRRRPDARLVLVGDGRLRASLEARAARSGLSGRVAFLGARPDVPRLLRSFDAFALSSLTEGYSLALLEASACALPIVATDVGGNREIVADGRTGHLVPPGSPERLAGALCALAEDAAGRRALGAEARGWALGEATTDVMSSRYEALYRAILAPAARASDGIRPRTDSGGAGR